MSFEIFENRRGPIRWPIDPDIKALKVSRQRKHQLQKRRSELALRGLAKTERATSAEGNSSPEEGVVQGEKKR